MTPIIEFDLSYVSRHAKSLLTPVVISNYQGKKPTILSTGVVLANTPVLTVDTGVVNQGSGKETSGSTNTITKKLTINNKHGIHARPAALLHQSIKAYNAEVMIHKGNQSAPVSSIVAMLGLGIEYQDEIEVGIPAMQPGLNDFH